MAIYWTPVEYGVARILLQEHDWSYNNIGREIHRTKVSVINKLKRPEKYRKPHKMTKKDWNQANEIVQMIVSTPHVPGEMDFLEASK